MTDDAARLIRAILWHEPAGPRLEHARLEETAGGHRLAGAVLMALDGVPATITYRVDVDATWATRSVAVQMDRLGGRLAVELATDGRGTWLRDDRPLPEAGGCLDVDLEASPVTNTLPVRRLGLAEGERRTIRVVWVRLPALDCVIAEQAYERLVGDRYRYSSGSFQADLDVDDLGLVTTYGPYWRTVARVDAP